MEDNYNKLEHLIKDKDIPKTDDTTDSEDTIESEDKIEPHGTTSQPDGSNIIRY